jgi:hypothetical protein
VALPRERGQSNRINRLASDLGNPPVIVLQGVPRTSPKPIVQEDDGYYQIDIDDDAGGQFESRQFAEAVSMTRPEALRVRQ